MRIGGASALFQATGEVEMVKRTGRWSSGAVQYLQDGDGRSVRPLHVTSPATGSLVWQKAGGSGYAMSKDGTSTGHRWMEP